MAARRLTTSSKRSRTQRRAPSQTSRKSRGGLRIPYADADRVRQHLLSEDVQELSRQDVRTLLKILDDVYPTSSRASTPIWLPLLIGIGIGLLLILGLFIVF